MSTQSKFRYGERVMGDRMVPCPWVLAPDDTMARAFELMREHAIRHIPVVQNDAVVGIVSDRDLNTFRSLRSVDPARVMLVEAMTAPAYTVSPETPLAEAVRVMTDKKYGAAVVVREGRIVGIFTTTDALSELARLLLGQSEPPPPR
jgi:acetoin utilization protein AcuB